MHKSIYSFLAYISGRLLGGSPNRLLSDRGSVAVPGPDGIVTTRPFTVAWSLRHPRLRYIEIKKKKAGREAARKSPASP